MSKDSKSKFLLNVKDLNAAVAEHKNIIFQMYTLDPKVEKNISNILTSILQKIDNIKIKNVLFTIIRELLVNGIKANSKRIHFFKKNLDIQNPVHYKEGILDFKDQLAENSKEYINLLLKNNLFVQVSISYKNDPIIISVINNSPIAKSEKTRIANQRKKAENIENLSEVIESIVDYSEGAGIGIPMILLMLKNAGSNSDAFHISFDSNFTKAQLSIPKFPKKEPIAQEIAEKIFDEIEQLPAFPENITHLQHLINDGSSSILDIAAIVKRDPSLTADLLRMANSAGYATYKRIESIHEALKNIGLKSFSGILTAVGAFKIIHSRYKKVFKDVWEHSLRTAFYAERLCTELNQKKIKESAYIAGLLHDLGKIVLLSLHPSIMKTLTESIGNKNQTNPVEDIAFGINHSDMGGLIAKHWNFEEHLIESIQLHHQPFLASEQNKNLVYISYLANFIQDVERGFADFFHLERCVLNHFNFNEDSLPDITERLQNKYNKF